MNQNERLDYIVKELCIDSVQYKNMEVKQQERRKIMRSLMNIRMPKPIPKTLLDIQDEFLREEVREKGIVKLEDIGTVQKVLNSNIKFGDKLSVWQGDITRLGVDAIVNAANSQMLGCFVPCHKCIDNAIHSAAGMELREVCNQYMTEKRKANKNYEEPTGRALITSGFNLPCKYVLHTVGPIVRYELTQALRKDLVSCYESCLRVAVENGVRSIAFCCISTGEFHFPNDEAAKIAVDTTITFLENNPDKIDRIIFNVFKDDDLKLYEALLDCSIKC